MTTEQLRKAYQERPFMPFDICLADGQRIPVTHPEFLYMVPGPVRTFVIGSPDGTYRIVDLLLVTSLEFKDGQSRGANANRNAQ